MRFSTFVFYVRFYNLAVVGLLVLVARYMCCRRWAVNSLSFPYFIHSNRVA